MKVIQIQGGYGLTHVKQVERQMPDPGPNEVLIKIRAVSLNSRDLGVISGFYQPDLSNPLVLTSDAVGEVVALGEKASRFNIGQRVSGIFTQSWISGEASTANWISTLGSPLDGMLAEYVVLPEQGLVHVPDYLTDAEAATLPCAGVTAWHAIVEEGGVKAGDTVVVQGTGGVSLFALQIAKLQGASVIVTSSSDEKLEKTRQLGADFGINYRVHPEWDKEVLKLTNGRGADLIIDVGGAATLNQSITALRVGGRISIVGLLSGGSVEGFNLVPALMRMARLQAISVGSREMFESMNRAFTQHSLRPVVDRIFPFEQAIDAFDYLENGSYFGKICITI